MATTAVAQTADATTVPGLSLMERVKAGDELAFNELYTTHYDRVITAVKRFITEVDIAEHIANGVFAKVWQVRNSASGFKGKDGASFATWVTRVAYNQALMHLRSNRTERTHTAFSLDDLWRENENGSRFKTEFISHDQNLEGSTDRRDLSLAISKLPPKYRTVFMMRLVEGFTTEETCETLNLEVTVVKSRLFRGRMMIQKMLLKKKTNDKR